LPNCAPVGTSSPAEPDPVLQTSLVSEYLDLSEELAIEPLFAICPAITLGKAIVTPKKDYIFIFS
jgi:hypothetical protein